MAEAVQVAVLVSVGRHPASGRPRRADRDARAVELALAAGLVPRLLHAGNADAPALQDYLGMGAAEIGVLPLAPDADALPVLAATLAAATPGLVLAGAAAESGEGSGMLPYLLAERLGLKLLPGVVGLERAGGALLLQQAIPGGRRRRLRAHPPLIATVAERAPPPRLPALGRARRGRIVTLPAAAVEPDAAAAWPVRAARARPQRAMATAVGSAAERLAAALGGGAGGGEVLTGLDADAAAEAILGYLAREGLVAAGR
jgi:electron transfer flavoprotein beta subunit